VVRATTTMCMQVGQRCLTHASPAMGSQCCVVPAALFTSIDAPSIPAVFVGCAPCSKLSDEELLERLLATEKDGAVASGKDYAQRPSGYKRMLSMKLDRQVSCWHWWVGWCHAGIGGYL
jgi:hypothetical protein